MRISYGFCFVLSIGISLYLVNFVIAITVLIVISFILVVPLRLSWYIFIVPDGFLVENVLGRKRKFSFEMYKGIIKDDVISRLTGNYLAIEFSDGSNYEFLSNDDAARVDANIRKEISELTTPE